jgi:putative ABC transport system substrate-binding protein
MAKTRADAVVLQDGFTIARRARIVKLAAARRLPAMYETRDWTTEGGLMAYGADAVDLYRRAATYMDRILKGAKPADLPVEQPTRFDLLVNLRTAKALGLTIPPSLLLQVTEAIQ